MATVQTDPDAPMIRTLQFDRDPETGAQSLMDIREFETPARSGNRSWTSLSGASLVAKRRLLLDLAAQVDQLVAGEVDEIRIVLSR